MKQKFLILLVSCLSVAVVRAQRTAADGATASKQAETTINGIPYSQYKAQQDAKQQAAKQVNLVTKTSTSPSSGTNPVAVVVENKPAVVDPYPTGTVDPATKQQPVEQKKVTEPVETQQAVIDRPFQKGNVMTMPTDKKPEQSIKVSPDAVDEKGTIAPKVNTTTSVTEKNKVDLPTQKTETPSPVKPRMGDASKGNDGNNSNGETKPVQTEAKPSGSSESSATNPAKTKTD